MFWTGVVMGFIFGVLLMMLLMSLGLVCRDVETIGDFIVCPHCLGHGTVATSICKRCDGKGIAINDR